MSTSNPSSDGRPTPQAAEVVDLSGRPPPRDGTQAVVALLHQAARVAELGQVEAARDATALALELLERLSRAR